MRMALLIVVVVLSGAMLAPGLVVGPSLDAAVFTHIGGSVLDGASPYLGSWDHKPPGIYLASAAVQAILGWVGPWTADWLLSLGATVGIGLAVATVLARLGVAGWPRQLGAIGATLLASHYLLALGGGLTEPVATALVAASLAIAVRPPGRAGIALAGGLLGISLVVSPQVLPGAVMVIGVAVGLQPARLRMGGAVLLVGAAALPVAATAAWLSLVGALPAALDAVVTYSAAYRAASEGYGTALGTPVAAWTVLISLYLITAALLGAASLGTASPRRRGMLIGSLLWIGGSLVLIVVQGHFYAHYVIPLTVPLGILAGLGLDRTRESLGRVRRSGMRILIALPLVATLGVSMLAGTYTAATQIAIAADQSERMQAVAARLRDLPAGTLLVWGNEPRLYDLAERVPATRYTYFFPLTTPGYTTPAMIDEVERRLKTDPPEVVVDAGSGAPGAPGFLPMLIPRPILTDGRDLDLLDPLRAFVAQRYELVATVAGWPIYVRRSGNSP